MSDEELKKTIEAMRSVTDEMTTSKEKALAFLVEHGFNTPSGELTEPYRNRA